MAGRPKRALGVQIHRCVAAHLSIFQAVNLSSAALRCVAAHLRTTLVVLS